MPRNMKRKTVKLFFASYIPHQPFLRGKVVIVSIFLFNVQLFF